MKQVDHLDLNLSETRPVFAWPIEKLLFFCEQPWRQMVFEEQEMFEKCVKQRFAGIAGNEDNQEIFWTPIQKKNGVLTP